MLSRHFLEGFDLLLASTVLSWRVVRTANQLDRPCVWLVHESKFGLEFVEQAGKSAKRAFAEAERVVFYSDGIANLFARHGGTERHVAVHPAIEDVAVLVGDETQPPFERVDGRLTR